MKETELKLHPCYCGGEMEIKKVAQNGGMDGTYWDWELTCKKCGLTMTYAADGFYGRKYKTFEEVIDDWNWNQKKKHIQEVLAQVDRSMECVMESDPRTLKNPQHEYGWLFDKIYEWRKELKGLKDGNDD